MAEMFEQDTPVKKTDTTHSSSNSNSNSVSNEGSSEDPFTPSKDPAIEAVTARELSPAPANSGTESSESGKRGKKGRKLVQATELRFQVIENRLTVARVALLLCNISDRPLFYKLKTDVQDSLSALPSATGHIAARGSSRVVLSWNRPKDANDWANVSFPKLLLVTKFLDGNKASSGRDVTSTRLIASIDTSSKCQADRPPLEQLMLDAVSKTIGDGGGEMTVTKSEETNPKSNSPIPRTREPIDLWKELEQLPFNVGVALAVIVALLLMVLYRSSHPVAVVVR
uniref:MSP domain-containing protein n=1 Tax=Panagrellus redivivus TaxID=6233 RepID=A0A7E4V8V9_PANRE